MTHHGLRISLVTNNNSRRILLELGLALLLLPLIDCGRALLQRTPVLLDRGLQARRHVRYESIHIRSCGSLAAAQVPLLEVLLARPRLPTTVRVIQLSSLLPR